MKGSQRARQIQRIDAAIAEAYKQYQTVKQRHDLFGRSMLKRRLDSLWEQRWILDSSWAISEPEAEAVSL